MCDPVSIGLSIAGNLLQGSMNQGSMNKATKQQMAGLDQASGAIQEGTQSGIKYLEDYLKSAQGNFQQGINTYQPTANMGNEAMTGYRDLMSGTKPLQEDPIFKEQERLLKQKMASMGLSQGATGVAQGYTPLLGDLYSRQLQAYQPLMQYGQSATNNIGNIYGQMGQANLNTGQAISNAYNVQGLNLANLYGQKGEAQAGGTLATTPQWSNMLSQLPLLLKMYPGGGK